MSNEAKVILTIVDNASTHINNINATTKSLNSYSKVVSTLGKQKLDFSKEINQTTQAIVNQNAVLKRNGKLLNNISSNFANKAINNGEKQYRSLADQNDKMYKLQLNHEEKMRKLKTQNTLNRNTITTIPRYNYSSLPNNQRQQEYFDLMGEKARLTNDELLLKNRLRQNTQTTTRTANTRARSRIDTSTSPLNRLGATGFDQSLYQAGVGLAATGGVLFSASRRANEMSGTQQQLMRALQDNELYTNVEELRKASDNYMYSAYKIGQDYGQSYQNMAELMASTAKQLQADPRIKDVNLRKQAHLQNVKMLTEFAVIGAKQMELDPLEAGNIVGRIYDMSQGQLKYQPKDIQNDITKSQRFKYNYIKQTMGFVDLVADNLPNVTEKDLIMSLSKYIKLNPKADQLTFLLESGLMKSEGVSNQVAGSAAQRYFTNILKIPELKKAFEASNSDIVEFTANYLSPKYQKEVDTYMKGSYARGLLKEIENDPKLSGEEKDIALKRKKDELSANELMRVAAGVTSEEIRIMPGIQHIIAFGLEVGKMMGDIQSGRKKLGDFSDTEAKYLELYNARKGDGAIQRVDTSQTIMKTDPNKIFVMFQNAFDKLLQTFGQKINESQMAQQGNGLARLSPLNVNNIDSIIKRIENNPAMTKLIIGLVEIIAIGLMMGLTKRVGKMAISGGIGNILNPFTSISSNIQSTRSGFSQGFQMMKQKPIYDGIGGVKTPAPTTLAIAGAFGGGIMGVLGALGTLATAASLLAIAFNVVKDAMNASADKRQEGSITGLLNYINSNRPEGQKFTSIQDAFNNMPRNEFDKKALEVINTKTNAKDRREFMLATYRQVDPEMVKRISSTSDFLSPNRILTEEQALREKDFITLRKMQEEDKLKYGIIEYKGLSGTHKYSSKGLGLFGTQASKIRNALDNSFYNSSNNKIDSIIKKQLPNATEEERLAIQNRLEEFKYKNPNATKSEMGKQQQSIINDFGQGKEIFMKQFAYHKANIDPNSFMLQTNNAIVQQGTVIKDNTAITQQNTFAITKLNENLQSIKEFPFGNINNQNTSYQTPMPSSSDFNKQYNPF
jgi:hypothetical protein